MDVQTQNPVSTSSDPPKTFQDILPPRLITTSTLSEAGYIGYRNSKFKTKFLKPTLRASTFPPPSSPTPQPTVSIQPNRRNYPPPTSRRSTLKKMKGVMNTIKRSISSLNDSNKKSRPPIPSSMVNSRFGTGPGRHSFRRQDAGYFNLSDEEHTAGEGSENVL